MNLTGKLEAIEKFAYVDAQAYVSQTFLSPFGAQPADLVNATQNRYTQQTYSVSPYIKGVFPSSNVSYQLRDDNYWTVASNYGNSSHERAQYLLEQPQRFDDLAGESVGMDTGVHPDLLRQRPLEQRLATPATSATSMHPPRTTIFSRPFPIRSIPSCRYRCAAGTSPTSLRRPPSKAPATESAFQWSPTDRTQVGGFWDHTFFGSSYSLQVSHRLPNAALSANVSRGINSYPQLALAIPAGASVTQFVDAAFTTRIPDPAERAQAVDQFLARTQLAPTLASPVNFYATSLTLQDAANLSLVLIGMRNSVGLSVFYLKSEAISGQGNVLPPALQFGQNNTQVGAGVNYSFDLEFADQRRGERDLFDDHGRHIDRPVRQCQVEQLQYERQPEYAASGPRPAARPASATRGPILRGARSRAAAYRRSTSLPR